MRVLARIKKLPVCLVVLAAAACGQSSGNEAGNEANAVIANETAPAAVESAADTPAATNTATTAAPYHANGTEPFWALTIAGGQMTYQPMEGPAVTEPLPAQTPIANGYRYVGNQLTVEVVHTACNNGMSEETFADTVHLTVAGQRLNGCGGQGDGQH
jgi:uncharacterized membrane protein